VGEIVAVGPVNATMMDLALKSMSKWVTKFLYSKYAGTDIKLGSEEYIPAG
jgi:co-chaperonin GroES (HSP10)